MALLERPYGRFQRCIEGARLVGQGHFQIARHREPLAEHGNARVAHARFERRTQRDRGPSALGRDGPVVPERRFELAIKRMLWFQRVDEFPNAAAVDRRLHRRHRIAAQQRAGKIPVRVEGLGVELSKPDVVGQTQKGVGEQEVGQTPCLRIPYFRIRLCFGEQGFEVYEVVVGGVEAVLFDGVDRPSNSTVAAADHRGRKSRRRYRSDRKVLAAIVAPSISTLSPLSIVSTLSRISTSGSAPTAVVAAAIQTSAANTRITRRG